MISIPNILSAVDHKSLVNRLVQFNVLAPLSGDSVSWEQMTVTEKAVKRIAQLCTFWRNAVTMTWDMRSISYDLHSCHEALRNMQSVFQDSGCLNLGLK